MKWMCMCMPILHQTSPIRIYPYSNLRSRPMRRSSIPQTQTSDTPNGRTFGRSFRRPKVGQVVTTPTHPVPMRVCDRHSWLPGPNILLSLLPHTHPFNLFTTHLHIICDDLVALAARRSRPQWDALVACLAVYFAVATFRRQERK